MKKIVITSLSVFLFFLHVQSLTPKNANPQVAKPKPQDIGKILKFKIFCMCPLTEKPALLAFTNNPVLPVLFKKLLQSILSQMSTQPEQVAKILKQLNIKPEKLKPHANDTNKLTKLVNALIGIADKNLTYSISQINQFLTKAKNPVAQDDMKGIFIKALDTLSPEELVEFEKLYNKNAFKTMVKNSNVLVETVMGLLQ